MGGKSKPINHSEKISVYQDAIDLLFGGIESSSPEKVPGSNHSMVTSMVQIDGDHCISIHHDALEWPGLPQVISDHHQRLDERLKRINAGFAKISRWLNYLWMFPLSISAADLVVQFFCWIFCIGQNVLIDFLDSNNVFIRSLFASLVLSLTQYIVPKLIRWYLFNRLEKKDQLPEKRQLILSD